MMMMMMMLMVMMMVMRMMMVNDDDDDDDDGDDDGDDDDDMMSTRVMMAVLDKCPVRLLGLFGQQMSSKQSFDEAVAAHPKPARARQGVDFTDLSNFGTRV